VRLQISPRVLGGFAASLVVCLCETFVFGCIILNAARLQISPRVENKRFKKANYTFNNKIKSYLEQF